MSDTIPAIMKSITPSKSPSMVESSPSLSAKISESVSKTASKMSPSSLSPRSDDGGAMMMKIGLIVLALAFLAYNVYLYYYEGTDILGKLFGMGIVGTGKVTQATVDVAAEGTKDTVNVAQEVTRDVTNKVEEVGEKIENRADNRVGRAIEGPNNLNDNDETKADLSTESEIQQPKQSGYCYIGTDRTFRSCVKMNSGDTCASKKVFPTKDICINPELRR
tara:strand:+ start:364 stop:1023 length:660 start_codon:yes stop_codon:yes gene_type:complete